MIYLLRHGETLWNRDGRQQGQRDSPLTRRGISQAEAMGRRLRDEIEDPRPWAVVASPLGRAWQSAAIVSEVLGLDPRAIALDARLAEMRFGAWEGRSFDRIDADQPGILARRAADKWQFRPPGGESYADLSDRVASWLSPIPAWAKFIVVCHGGTGRVLRGRFANLPPEATASLENPQDELYRLHDGRIEVLKTSFAATGTTP